MPKTIKSRSRVPGAPLPKAQKLRSKVQTSTNIPAPKQHTERQNVLLWQRLRDASIQRKLFLALGITAILSAVGLATSIFVIDRTLRTQLLDQAQSELSVMSINYDIKVNQMKLGFKGQAFNAEIIDTALRQKPSLTVQNILINEVANRQIEFATLTNTEARIISSANANRYGAKFDPQELVTQALKSGEQVSSTEIISYDELAADSPRFAELRAAETLIAAGSKPNFLVRYTVTPVRRPNSQIVGTLVSGDIVKPQIPALTNQVLNGGFAAIFSDSNLIASSLSLQEQMASPTIVNSSAVDVAREAITTGGRVKREIALNNKAYAVAAMPIVNAKGKPVGVLMRGVSEENLSELISSTIMLVLGVGLLSLIVALSIARVVGRMVTEPVKKLEKSAQEFAKGNLDARAPVESKDEIGVLSEVFNQLAQNLQQQQIQESAAKLELETQSLYLQEEVGHLLDIVSELESGDLTVQANVSDQATGLIADTLNRLIEQLSKVMATVLSTSQQVARGASTLEELAIAVSNNTQQQVQSVGQAQVSMENVNILAQGASDLSLKADEALQSAQLAVVQGQKQVANLTTAIAQLQQGSAQMVQRIKTLGEFVDLAKQFVQDQKRLASLTQVLAMNASMIAARAVEQKEPDQFASVAREFEAIAAQVNNLATQTNQGLVVLQQRTGFIEIVVSGIEQDVNDVSSLVSEFTSSVEQSRTSFDNIKNVTKEVAQVGKIVTKSSQEIAEAVKASFRSIQDIASVAERSANQARFTREQAGVMGEIAQQLVEEMQFFRLPESKILQTIEAVSWPVHQDALESSNGYHTEDALSALTNNSNSAS